MANFKLKRRPDFPSGLDAAEMTLAEHIASAAPHPNWTPSGGSGGGDLSHYALANHTHDDLYLKLTQVGLNLAGRTLTNIFAPYTHTHPGYAALDHNHDNEYVKLGDNSGSGSRGDSGVSRDGLIIPTPYHSITYTESNGNILPVDSGIVDANRLISNGRYMIDAAQSEMTYKTNGAPYGVLQVTLQNLNGVSFGVLVTRLTSDGYRTSTAGTENENDLQETSLPRVWSIIQTLYAKDAIYTRFGKAKLSSNISYPASPTSTEYKASKDGLYYASMVKTFIATSGSGNSNVGTIQATKTVVYNVLPAYDPYTEGADIHPVAITRDPTTNEIQAPSSNIWNTTPESTSEEYEVTTYKFDPWKSTSPSPYVDVTQKPELDSGWVRGGSTPGLGVSSSYSYTVTNEGWIVIEITTGKRISAKFGNNTDARELNMGGATNTGDTAVASNVFYLKANTTITFYKYDDKEPGSTGYGIGKEFDNSDYIRILEYGKQQ